MNPLKRDETHYIDELWHLRDLDRHKGKDARKHLKRRKEITHWLIRRKHHIERFAKVAGWKRSHRGARRKIIARAIAFQRGGRVPHEAGAVGKRALAAGAPYVGKHETGNNDADWLRHCESFLVDHGHALSWMIPGNPYCGFGVIFEYQAGPGIFLPDNFVSTGNICPSANRIVRDKEGRRFKLARVSYERMKPGDIIVFGFGSSSAHHTGLARGPARGGQAPTREWNTSPSNGGSQSNGGGVYDRWRSTGMMLCALTLVEVK